MLESVLNSIKKAFTECWDEEEIFEIFSNIPEELWKDRYSSSQIIRTLVDYKDWEWDIPVTDFIPESFWSYKENAKVAISIILASPRSDIYGVFPKHLFEDRDIALTMVSSDWRYLDRIDDEFKADGEFACGAIGSLITEMETIRGGSASGDRAENHA